MSVVCSSMYSDKWKGLAESFFKTWAFMNSEFLGLRSLCKLNSQRSVFCFSSLPFFNTFLSRLQFQVKTSLLECTPHHADWHSSSIKLDVVFSKSRTNVVRYHKNHGCSLSDRGDSRDSEIFEQFYMPKLLSSYNKPSISFFLPTMCEVSTMYFFLILSM